MATRADLTRLTRIGRYLLHTPRAVWEFPLQEREERRDDDGHSDAVVDTEGGVAEQRRITRLQHVTLCDRGHWTGQHDT